MSDGCFKRQLVLSPMKTSSISPRGMNLNPMALLVSASLLVGRTAVAASFDFESQPLASSLSSLALSDSGLTMTLSRNGGALFGIQDLTPTGPPSWGSRTLSPFTAGGPEEFVADFSSPIALFQMEFGDYNADAETFVMNAYSGLGGTVTLLGTFTMFWPASNTFPDDVGIGSISAAGIQSVVFTSSGIFNDSLFYDNIVTRSASGVPGSTTAILLSLVSRVRLVAATCGGATKAANKL